MTFVVIDSFELLLYFILLAGLYSICTDFYCSFLCFWCFIFLDWRFCSSLSLQVFHLCLVIWTSLMCLVVSTLLACPHVPFAPHQIVACLSVFTFLSDFYEFLVFLVFVHIVQFLDFVLSLAFCLCSLWICLSILD